MSDIYEDDDESDDSKFFPVSVNGETKDEAEQAVASDWHAGRLYATRAD